MEKQRSAAVVSRRTRDADGARDSFGKQWIMEDIGEEKEERKRIYDSGNEIFAESRRKGEKYAGKLLTIPFFGRVVT